MTKNHGKQMENLEVQNTPKTCVRCMFKRFHKRFKIRSQSVHSQNRYTVHHIKYREKYTCVMIGDRVNSQT